jgi:hypothetical protein
VEELEDRLGDRMEEILLHVNSSLTVSLATITTNGIHPTQQTGTFESHGLVDHAVYLDMDEEVYVQEDIVFDDMGEGAGVEGELDMDDD